MTHPAACRARSTTTAIAAILMAGALVAGQTPSFEVASIKPNKSGDFGVRIGMQPGGRFTVSNAPLREIIRLAYQVQDFQIVGAPDWTRSEHFDIVAKGPADMPAPPMPMPAPGGPPNPMLLMLRTLLGERFTLAAHMEPREMPVYALVLAKPDGRLGPKLSKTRTDCAALMAAARQAGSPPPMPKAGEAPACGSFGSPGSFAGGSIPLSQLATMLSTRMGRVVIDRTQLTGNYDFMLTFMPDQMPQLPPGGLPAGAPPMPPIDPNAPSLSTALEEQLGLKIESTRSPVDVLVIDSVQPPTPD